MLQHDDSQIAHRHLEPDCPRGLYRLPALTVGVLIRRSCDIQSGASNFQPDPVRLFFGICVCVPNGGVDHAPGQRQNFLTGLSREPKKPW